MVREREGKAIYSDYFTAKSPVMISLTFEKEKVSKEIDKVFQETEEAMAQSWGGQRLRLGSKKRWSILTSQDMSHLK